MGIIDFSAIILSVLGMVSGWFSWWLDRKRHKQEVKTLEIQAKDLEAETEQKYMHVAKMYVDEYSEKIVKPLENRVNELTNEVKELKDELEFVKKSACYCVDCPNRVSVL